MTDRMPKMGKNGTEGVHNILQQYSIRYDMIAVRDRREDTIGLCVTGYDSLSMWDIILYLVLLYDIIQQYHNLLVT